MGGVACPVSLSGILPGKGAHGATSAKLITFFGRNLVAPYLFYTIGLKYLLHYSVETSSSRSPYA